MWRIALVLSLFVIVADGQYPQVIGFLPIYRPNNTYSAGNNSTNYQNNSWNGGCKPPQFDLPASHSLFVGCVQKNDTLLLQQLVDKPARLFSAREKTIDYPNATVPQGYIRNMRITAVRCYDLKARGKGGYARILSGGVGQYSVKINLTSMEWNRGLHFRVEIYGR